MVATTANNYVCHHFARRGECLYGTKCKHIHLPRGSPGHHETKISSAKIWISDESSSGDEASAATKLLAKVKSKVMKKKKRAMSESGESIE